MYTLNFSASWSIMAVMGEAGVDIGFMAMEELSELGEEVPILCISVAEDEGADGVTGI